MRKTLTMTITSNFFLIWLQLVLFDKLNRKDWNLLLFYMPWFIYNSIKNYSAWEANRSFLVPFCKLVNWCFQLFFLTICRWSQVMHYDFFSEVNVNKRSAQRDKLKEKFSKLFSGYIFFDWCLFISADFRILRNDIKINFTNCLS